MAIVAPAAAPGAGALVVAPPVVVTPLVGVPASGDLARLSGDPTCSGRLTTPQILQDVQTLLAQFNPIVADVTIPSLPIFASLDRNAALQSLQTALTTGITGLSQEDLNDLALLVKTTEDQIAAVPLAAVAPVPIATVVAPRSSGLFGKLIAGGVCATVALAGGVLYNGTQATAELTRGISSYIGTVASQYGSEALTLATDTMLPAATSMLQSGADAVLAHPYIATAVAGAGALYAARKCSANVAGPLNLCRNLPSWAMQQTEQERKKAVQWANKTIVQPLKTFIKEHQEGTLAAAGIVATVALSSNPLIAMPVATAASTVATVISTATLQQAASTRYKVAGALAIPAVTLLSPLPLLAVAGIAATTAVATSYAFPKKGDRGLTARAAAAQIATSQALAIAIDTETQIRDLSEKIDTWKKTVLAPTTGTNLPALNNADLKQALDLDPEFFMAKLFPMKESNARTTLQALQPIDHAKIALIKQLKTSATTPEQKAIYARFVLPYIAKLPKEEQKKLEQDVKTMITSLAASETAFDAKKIAEFCNTLVNPNERFEFQLTLLKGIQNKEHQKALGAALVSSWTNIFPGDQLPASIKQADPSPKAHTREREAFGELCVEISRSSPDLTPTIIEAFTTARRAAGTEEFHLENTLFAKLSANLFSYPTEYAKAVRQMLDFVKVRSEASGDKKALIELCTSLVSHSNEPENQEKACVQLAAFIDLLLQNETDAFKVRDFTIALLQAKGEALVNPAIAALAKHSPETLKKLSILTVRENNQNDQNRIVDIMRASGSSKLLDYCLLSPSADPTTRGVLPNDQKLALLKAAQKQIFQEWCPERSSYLMNQAPSHNLFQTCPTALLPKTESGWMALIQEHPQAVVRLNPDGRGNVKLLHKCFKGITSGPNRQLFVITLVNNPTLFAKALGNPDFFEETSAIERFASPNKLTLLQRALTAAPNMQALHKHEGWEEAFIKATMRNPALAGELKEGYYTIDLAATLAYENADAIEFIPHRYRDALVKDAKRGNIHPKLVGRLNFTLARLKASLETRTIAADPATDNGEALRELLLPS